MNIRELLRKTQLLLIIACGTYPVLMIVIGRFAPELLPFGWLYAAAYLVLSLAGIQIKGRFRLISGVAMSAGLVAVSLLLAPEGAAIGACAAAVLCSGLLLWSLQMGGWSGKQEIAVLWIAAGVLCQLVGQIAVHMDRVDGGEGVARYSAQVMLSLFGFALLTMLSMNRNGLNVASGKRQSVPQMMKRKNALLTGAMFALALLAALLPSVLSGMSEVLKQGLLWLLRLIERLFPKVPPTQLEDGITSAEGPGQVGAGVDPGFTLNPVVEKIALFVGSVLTLLMLLFLLYQIAKFLRGGIQKLMDGLGKFSSNVGEDYIDEVTDTREEITPEALEKKRAATRLPFLEPRNLPPAERIRFRYQRLMRKHPEWDAGSTARETLPGEMAAIYERARYSSHPVHEEDAASFADGSRSI